MTALEDVVTVTVTTAPPAEEPTSLVEKRTPIQTKTGTPTATPPESIVPAYLSDQCTDAGQYSSACVCMGVSASTVTAPAVAVTSTTTIASTVTEYDYESPPLPSSSVSFPDDDSWTSTYTYAEYTLPVFPSAAPDPTIKVDFPPRPPSA